MSDAAVRIASAATLLWLGMVLAISFLEAPLKFRTPGLELQMGLAIGRLVFRALNVAELFWGLAVVGCLIADPQSAAINTLAVITGVLLVVQLAVVRPRLNRRSDQVLAAPPGQDAPRSHAHLAYVALEVLKVVMLIALACYLLAA